jgi:hypothetical protein
MRRVRACVCLCMYVCMYVCMSVCMLDVCMDVIYMYVCPYVCMSVCLYVCLSVYTNARTYVLMYVCMDECVCVCVCVCCVCCVCVPLPCASVFSGKDAISLRVLKCQELKDQGSFRFTTLLKPNRAKATLYNRAHFTHVARLGQPTQYRQCECKTRAEHRSQQAQL